MATSKTGGGATRAGAAFSRLVEVMARLRGPDGCPWDREQTLATLRQYLVEEAYEVLEAIEEGTPAEHCEELGDLLLQVVFQARVREEEGHFDVADVAEAIASKLHRRHPHVFADGDADTAAAVKRKWSDIKEQEEGKRSAVDGVPEAMPALLRGLRVSEKAATAGFDWRSPVGVFEKMDEERAELQAAIESGDGGEIEHEIGDFLFTVVSLCRHLEVDPEAALRRTVRRFERRYRHMEAQIKADGHRVRGLEDAELERRWQAAKKALESGDGE